MKVCYLVIVNLTSKRKKYIRELIRIDKDVKRMFHNAIFSFISKYMSETKHPFCAYSEITSTVIH